MLLIILTDVGSIVFHLTTKLAKKNSEGAWSRPFE